MSQCLVKNAWTTNYLHHPVHFLLPHHIQASLTLLFKCPFQAGVSCPCLWTAHGWVLLTLHWAMMFLVLPLENLSPTSTLISSLKLFKVSS